MLSEISTVGTSPDQASFRGRGTGLLLLSKYFARQFFPGTLEDELKSVFETFVHLDPDELSRAECLELIRELRPSVIIVGWGAYMLDSSQVVGAEGLEYVCNTCGGVRDLIPRRLIEDGLLVSDWGASISPVVAEGALLLILAASRRLVSTLRGMREGDGWNLREGRTLYRKPVGFHGFGRIAQALARQLMPFEVRLSVHAPGVPDSLIAQFGAAPCHSLPELFASNEIVVELEALNAETEGIITEELLRSIPPNGSFINVARAGLVEEEALLRVAREGRLHFGIDVFHQEPLPTDSILRHLDNVVLTPHSAGPTRDSLVECGRYALKNLRRWAAGEPVESAIDLRRFDLMT